MIKEHIIGIKQSEGGFSQLGLWKIKQKFYPLSTDPPMAKKDENGLVITSPNLLKDLHCSY